MISTPTNRLSAAIPLVLFAGILFAPVGLAGEDTHGLIVTKYPFHGRRINMDKPVAVESPQLPEVAMAGEKWAKLGVLDASSYDPSPLVKEKDDLFWAAKFTGGASRLSR